MKHHYIVQAVMWQWNQEFLCPMGATCAREELGITLKKLGVKRYRIKMIDMEPVADWESTDWIPA